MTNEIQNVKKVILTWTYNMLNGRYPDDFKMISYTDVIGGKTITKTIPNVYWINTLPDRPELATECYLDVTLDHIPHSGTDGEFYSETTTVNGSQVTNYYTKIEETHIITVYFIVSSMRRENSSGSTVLSDVQAQNLVLDACSYLRRMLKSEGAGNYFLFDNEIFKPIFVLAHSKDMTDIEDTSDFEDTRNRHTCQFSCKFSFTITDKAQAQLAKGVLVNDESGSEIIDIDFT